MKTHIYISFFFLTLMAASSFTQNAAVDQSVVIIVNKDNPIESLTMVEVKLYWLRKVKKRWPEINKNIRPADRKGKSTEQEVFYKKVLKMSANDVEAYFNQRQYESAEKPQDKFGSDQDIIEFVAEQEGSIGYISAGSVNSDLKAKVKIVAKID